MCDELDLLSKQIYSQRCSAHASAFLQSQIQEQEMKEIPSGDKNRVSLSYHVFRDTMYHKI